MANGSGGAEALGQTAPQPVRKRGFSLKPTPWRHDADTILVGRSLPRSLFGLAIKLSGGDQVWLCLLAIAVALLDTAPIEVQRRMINHAIKESGMRSIALLALTYAGLVLLQGLTKLLSNIYRGWVSEHSVRGLRSYINGGAGRGHLDQVAAKDQGTQISMIVSESEPIGAFLGECFSEPLLQGGVMVSVVAYLIYLEPTIALVLLGVYVPQTVFVPLIQRAVNRRAQKRIAILREASAGVIDGEHNPEADQEERFSSVFTLNMGVYRLKYSMNFLMNLCHQLGIAAILGVGGWFVVIGKIQVGTVVAFISGLHTVKDPWDDLATWFQTMMVTQARYDLLVKTLAKPRETPSS